MHFLKMHIGRNMSSTLHKLNVCNINTPCITNRYSKGINARYRQFNRFFTFLDTRILHSELCLHRYTHSALPARHDGTEQLSISVQAPCPSTITSPAPSRTPTTQSHHLSFPSPAFVSAVIVSLSSAYTLISPLPAMATEFAPPPGFFDFFLDKVQSFGPFGPIVFILIVALFESIPLFPTQPLSLASGVLFGAQKGAVCMLTGTTLAAIIAFTIARGVGRTLAEKIIASESNSSSSSSDNEGTSSSNTTKQNALTDQLAIIQDKIQKGTWLQQATAIFVLRMTPVIPFSASNYLLGLSPMPLSSYLAGTVAGMSFWAVGYASLGGASRSLLIHKGGAGALVGELLHRASDLTGDVTVAGLSAAAVVAGMVGWSAWQTIMVPKGEK